MRKSIIFFFMAVFFLALCPTLILSYTCCQVYDSGLCFDDLNGDPGASPAEWCDIAIDVGYTWSYYFGEDSLCNTDDYFTDTNNFCTGGTCDGGACLVIEICDDGVDNDGDGLVDCADLVGCRFSESCIEYYYAKVDTEVVDLTIDGAIENCNQMIIDGDAYLTQDITCELHGFTFSENYIELDCQGHTINGDCDTSEEDCYGIKLEENTGVTVKNCGINNFRYGILLEESSASFLEDNNLDGNVYGLYLDNSDSNYIKGNSVIEVNELINYDYGVFLIGSSSNEIESNAALGLYRNAYVTSWQGVDSENNNFMSNWFCFATETDFGIGNYVGNLGSNNLMDLIISSGDYPDTSDYATCYEVNACTDGLDNDADGLTDCADVEECNYVQYSETQVCVDGNATTIPYNPKAAPDPIMEEFYYVETYNDFLDMLNMGTVITSAGSDCNTECANWGMTCGFAEAGQMTCDQTGTTKCTCYLI